MSPLKTLSGNVKYLRIDFTARTIIANPSPEVPRKHDVPLQETIRIFFPKGKAKSTLRGDIRTCVYMKDSFAICRRYLHISTERRLTNWTSFGPLKTMTEQ